MIPAGPPIPYDSGTRRNSRRAPAPYPARVSTPAEATKPVIIAIVRVVVELTIADKPPTRRISRMGLHSKRGGTNDGCRTPLLPQRWTMKMRLPTA